MTAIPPSKLPVATAVQEPPSLQGTYEDAVTLRRWSFLQRTPTQRLEWLVSMLRVAYQSGASKPREPGSLSRHEVRALRRGGLERSPDETLAAFI